jgi:sec-independent protein translocase protein TatA
MFSLGMPELLVILGVAVLIFGPKRLSGIGTSLGRGMREFKDAISGDHPKEREDPAGTLRPGGKDLQG